MSILSNRLNNFKPSLTVKVSQKARELSSKGINIISLSSGEPDFDTPIHVKDEGIKAINNGFTKYTAVDGIDLLKLAITQKFKKDNSINYDLDQITVGVGGKHVIFNLFMSTLNQGDEVIIPSPFWVSYPDIVSLCDGKPVVVNTSDSNKFKMTPAELESKITKKNKMGYYKFTWKPYWFNL